MKALPKETAWQVFRTQLWQDAQQVFIWAAGGGLFSEGSVSDGGRVTEDPVCGGLLILECPVSYGGLVSKGPVNGGRLVPKPPVGDVRAVIEDAVSGDCLSIISCHQIAVQQAR